jgi:uncharacterized protein (DUF433 family)
MTSKPSSRITSDPTVLAGKPVVSGTRLSVELILDLLAGGWSEAQVLENYPSISRADIQACLAFARDAVRQKRPHRRAA